MYTCWFISESDLFSVYCADVSCEVHLAIVLLVVWVFFFVFHSLFSGRLEGMWNGVTPFGVALSTESQTMQVCMFRRARSGLHWRVRAHMSTRAHACTHTLSLSLSLFSLSLSLTLANTHARTHPESRVNERASSYTYVRARERRHATDVRASANIHKHPRACKRIQART